MPDSGPKRSFPVRRSAPLGLLAPCRKSFHDFPQLDQFAAPAIAKSALPLGVCQAFILCRFPRPAAAELQGQFDRAREEIAPLEGQRGMQQGEGPHRGHPLRKPRPWRDAARFKCPLGRRLSYPCREQLGIRGQKSVGDHPVCKSLCEPGRFPADRRPNLTPRGEPAQRMDPVAQCGPEVGQGVDAGRDVLQGLRPRVHDLPAVSTKAWITARWASGISSFGKNRL